MGSLCCASLRCGHFFATIVSSVASRVGTFHEDMFCVELCLVATVCGSRCVCSSCSGPWAAGWSLALAAAAASRTPEEEWSGVLGRWYLGVPGCSFNFHSLFSCFVWEK